MFPLPRIEPVDGDDMEIVAGAVVADGHMERSFWRERRHQQGFGKGLARGPT